MNLEARKIEFIQSFLKIQDEEIISRLEEALWNEIINSTDDEFEPMTIQEFNDRIDKSMDDFKNGRYIESSELKAKIDKW